LHTTRDSLHQRNFRSIQTTIRSTKEISAPFNPRFAPTKKFSLHSTHDSLQQRNFRSIQPAIRSNKEIFVPFNPRIAPIKTFSLHSTLDSLQQSIFAPYQRSSPIATRTIYHKRLIR